MPRLPSGTVTFLFADIEGSTLLLQRLGDQYAGMLESYRRLLRAAIKEVWGHEVSNEGDGFFVAFHRGSFRPIRRIGDSGWNLEDSTLASVWRL